MPLVTIICLNFNQEKFLKESLQSIFAQTYKNIEVIVVDNGSTDNSVPLIKEILTAHPNVKFIEISDNIGNCKAVNKAFTLAKGKYLIDLAADDVLLPNKIERQVEFFENLEESYGILYGNVQYIDEEGLAMGLHFFEKSKRKFYEGDVFEKVLGEYFIPSPSMMIRASMFREIGGYDEGLAYEDFDLFVRASRNYKIAFQNEVLTQVRKVRGSMGTWQYKKGSKQTFSTYIVCKKALGLVQNEREMDALTKRVWYELRQNVLSENFIIASFYFKLLKEMGKISFSYYFWGGINKSRLRLSGLRNIYLKLLT